MGKNKLIEEKINVNKSSLQIKDLCQKANCIA